MTDSPAVRSPLDPKEQPILDRVLSIRDKLSILKEDKSTYIKSQDVLALYDEVINQVHLLNDIREQHGKTLEQNRGSYLVHAFLQVRGIALGQLIKSSVVDNVLEDCFQLISLFFLTIGRNNEAPAV